MRQIRSEHTWLFAKRSSFVAKDTYDTIQINANSSCVLNIILDNNRYVDTSMKNLLFGSTQYIEPIDPIAYDNLRFFNRANTTKILVRFGLQYQTDVTCEPKMVPGQDMDITYLRESLLRSRETVCLRDGQDAFAIYRMNLYQSLYFSATMDADMNGFTYEDKHYTRLSDEGCIYDPPAPASPVKGWITFFVIVIQIAIAVFVGVREYNKRHIKHIPLPTA